MIITEASSPIINDFKAHYLHPTRPPQIRDLDVTTHVSPAKSLDEAPPIPWWVIVLATMAGVLILLIIILILWKVSILRKGVLEL